MKIKLDKKLKKQFLDEIKYLFDRYDVDCVSSKSHNIKVLKEVLSFNLAHLAYKE